MDREKSYEELKKENEELRELLLKVCKAYDMLQEALSSRSDLLERDGENATVQSASDVKKLLNKYSRL
ncbi:MAG: hypothetical protein PUC05_02940 [Firmicutes bacterium]|nr:hypothetical protein [Bacillota bacterium]